VAPDSITGWTFEPDRDERVWVVDGGDHQPLVLVAGGSPNAPDQRSAAEAVVASMVIGDPGPHPVDPADWGTDS
jgi:hypothetical protein